MEARSVSVVLPVHSEEDILFTVVESIRTFAGDALLEVIAIVSPRSRPRTFDICRELAARYPVFRFEEQRENPGLGRAIRQGIAASSGTYVLMIDADNEMDASSIREMIRTIDEGAFDLVQASRWLRPGGFRGYAASKLALNRLGQIFLRSIFRTSATDMTLGYKLVRAELLKRLPLEGTRHEIAVETTLRPLAAGARYAEVPTVWTAREHGSSKNSWAMNLRYLSMAWRIHRDRRVDA